MLYHDVKRWIATEIQDTEDTILHARHMEEDHTTYTLALHELHRLDRMRQLTGIDPYPSCPSWLVRQYFACYRQWLDADNMNDGRTMRRMVSAMGILDSMYRTIMGPGLRNTLHGIRGHCRLED